MKKYIKMIILLLISLFIIIGSIWYLDSYNKLEEGFASLESNNWPEIINEKEDLSNTIKGYLISTYGDGRKVNIESLELYHPEDDRSYIQVNYKDDIYIADKVDNQLFIFNSDLMDGNIDTNIDYNNELSHIEKPNDEVLEKINQLLNTFSKVYKDYNFRTYKIDEFPTSINDSSSNLYVRRDDGFAQFAVSYVSDDKEKNMNLIILFSNDNIIGLAIQIS